MHRSFYNPRASLLKTVQNLRAIIPTLDELAAGNLPGRQATINYE